MPKNFLKKLSDCQFINFSPPPSEKDKKGRDAGREKECLVSNLKPKTLKKDWRKQIHSLRIVETNDIFFSTPFPPPSVLGEEVDDWGGYRRFPRRKKLPSLVARPFPFHPPPIEKDRANPYWRKIKIFKIVLGTESTI